MIIMPARSAYAMRFHSDVQGQCRSCDAYRPCRARIRLQAHTASQAGSMLPEIPVAPLRTVLFKNRGPEQPDEML